MATILPISKTQLIILSLLFSLALVFDVSSSAEDGLVRTIDWKLSSLGKQKLSHFHFYWHDIFNGSNPTAMDIIEQPGYYSFGSVSMFDDPMTEGPELSSKLLGRAEGFYAQASHKEGALIQVMNLHFSQGEYNGSTITVLGRNNYNLEVREMPVIGGSGHFRFAQGYALAQGHIYNAINEETIVEYDVYVFHYDQYDGAFNV